MSLTLQNIYDHIQPYLLRRLTKEQLEWVFDTEMIRLVNEVQEDLNIKTYANLERFYQKVTGQQFVLAGEVLEFIEFYLYDELFSTQKWCLAEEVASGLKNTIVFKTSITQETRLDISYLRKVGQIESASDTLDLPSQLESIFENLLRTKCDVVFGNAPNSLYDSQLNALTPDLQNRVRSHLDDGPKSSVGGFARDDFDYDLLDSEVGNENVTADVSGTYSWTGED